MRHRILQAATDRAARFRPLLEELAALPAAAAVVVLNERSIPSPRGGLWYEAQVIRMRKLLAAGPQNAEAAFGVRSRQNWLQGVIKSERVFASVAHELFVQA